MASCFNKTPVLSINVRVLLVVCRGKTTRPQEWKDKTRYEPKVHPDQRPVEETTISRGHKWMDVRWKSKNTAETLIHSMAIDESRRTDPKEARRISDNKLMILRNSLMARGYVLMQRIPA